MVRKLIKRITKWAVGLGIDFYLHVLAMMLIAWVVALTVTLLRVAGVINWPDVLPGLLGALVAIAVGVAKEWLDERGGGEFSLSDMNANYIGAAFFYLIYIL